MEEGARLRGVATHALVVSHQCGVSLRKRWVPRFGRFGQCASCTSLQASKNRRWEGVGSGVQSIPAQPRDTRGVLRSGTSALYHAPRLPHRSTMAMQSLKVDVSGTVGPEAMTSNGSPMTSDRTRVTMDAGAARRASCPPFTAEMCLRTAFSSSMEAPQARSDLLVARRSSSVNPMDGQHSSAEAPPLTTNTTTVCWSTSCSALSTRGCLGRPPSTANQRTYLRMALVPDTLASSGTGCAASRNSTRLHPHGNTGGRWSYLVTTQPRAMWSPSTAIAASAIGYDALPAPMRTTWVEETSKPQREQALQRCGCFTDHRRLRARYLHYGRAAGAQCRLRAACPGSPSARGAPGYTHETRR